MNAKYIVNALLMGKFKPLTEQDYDGFAGAGPAACMWIDETDGACYIVDPDKDSNQVIVNIFDKDGETVYIGELILANGG